MSMGFTTHKHLELCADDEDPSQLIIQPGWDAPHVRCFPGTFCAWPCLLRQVGTDLGSPCDCIVTGITYANPGSRHGRVAEWNIELSPRDLQFKHPTAIKAQVLPDFLVEWTEVQ